MAEESSTERADREARENAERARAAEEQRKAAERAAETAKWLAGK
jgi:hypothetical protein